MTSVRLPFGRHAGKLISELPIDYVRWGSMKMTDIHWRQLFTQELERRKNATVAVPVTAANFSKSPIKLNRKSTKKLRLVDHVFRNFFNKKDKENEAFI